LKVKIISVFQKTARRMGHVTHPVKMAQRGTVNKIRYMLVNPVFSSNYLIKPLAFRFSESMQNNQQAIRIYQCFIHGFSP